MKKFWLATVGPLALGMAAPASAADLAARPYTKAPPAPVVAIYDWSGFYIGANGGGGWSHKCWDVTNFRGPVVPVSEGCHDATGGVVGGQVGYRWQSASWVFGLEAQGDWANLKGSNISLFIPNWTNNSKIEALGLFTGQVGYAWNNVLWYVKGGAAVTDDKYRGTVTPTGVLFDSASETRWGGVVGTGLEFGFAPNWSVAVEYDHLFMGTRAVTFTSAGVLGGIPAGSIFRTDSIRQDVDMVTARINYRFNWGSPLVAKY
ncbi:MAG TPA: outer membrane beta-barrel protein [Bradyrhizobium sp.]|nr:outer membrane beta-barrel protein [Bradyrhizobium sp.]